MLLWRKHLFYKTHNRLNPISFPRLYTYINKKMNFSNWYTPCMVNYLYVSYLYLTALLRNSAKNTLCKTCHSAVTGAVEALQSSVMSQ